MLFYPSSPSYLASKLPMTRPPAAQARVAGGRFTLWLAHGLDAAEASDQLLPPPAFAPLLFTTMAHARTQPGADELIWTALIDNLTGARVGQWVIWPDRARPGFARSPGQAPFGGPQATGSVPLAALTEWVKWVLKALADLGFQQLQLRLPPEIYAPTGLTRLVAACQAAGLRTSRKLSVVSHYVPISTADGYEKGLAAPTLRRYYKLRVAAHTTQQEPLEALPELLAMLNQWRALRGHRMSLSAAELTKLVRAFPEQFVLLSVRSSSGTQVAVVVAVWVTPQVLYYFMPASDPAYDPSSPTILLIGGLYDYCRAAGGTYLDLGPSLTADNAFNASLARFKRNVGGLPSLRLTVHGSLRVNEHEAIDALMSRLRP